MPRPNIPPWNQPGGGLPNSMPYDAPPWNNGPWEQNPPVQGPNLPPMVPGGSGPNPPNPPHLPPIPSPGSNTWNPWEGAQGGNWNNPFQGPTYGSQYQNWHPDFGGNGAMGMYQNLISTDENASATGWNDYVKSLSNRLLTSGMLAPEQAQIYYGTLNPDMQYGATNDPTPYNTPTNDTQAQQWYKPEYWDDLSSNIGQFLGGMFGEGDNNVAGDQSEGAQDQLEKANRWLKDVIDMGKRYSGEGSYWSTANARDRANGWEYLQNQAGALGLNEEFMNLGSSIYNPGVGQGPVDTYLNTGSFRRRNQNYQ